jgi:hypothetical protein
MFLSPIRHQPFTPQQQRVGNESLTTNQKELLALLDTALDWLQQIPELSNNSSDKEAFFTFFSTFYSELEIFQKIPEQELNNSLIISKLEEFATTLLSNSQGFYRIYHPILGQRLKQYKTDINSKEITTLELLNAERSKIASWLAPLQNLKKGLIGQAEESHLGINATFDEIRQTLLPPRRRPKP